MRTSTVSPHLGRQKFKPRVPSRIYRRGDFYYFRFILPLEHRERFGQEIRVSLKTPFRQKALELAGKLYADIKSVLASDPQMDLKELRRRFSENIQMKLEADTCDLAPRSPSAFFTDIEKEHPEYT
jgi:hypothetical protein